MFFYLHYSKLSSVKKINSCNFAQHVSQKILSPKIALKRTINTVTLHLDVSVIVPTPKEKRKKGYHMQVNGDREGGWGVRAQEFQGKGHRKH